MILFIDMNSYFATCEQQVNYWLRGRPVGVCVYTGKYGCIIAPSIEAKRAGVKTGMRLVDAIKLCPDLVPLETNPRRYRDFHLAIMNVLRKYSDHVIPKSIDEAIVDLNGFDLLYKSNDDLIRLAKKIKKEIREEVGDYLTCSVGIAPNAFLAKLASGLQKPDGLQLILPENIDRVLAKLQLTDLPGISTRMTARLNKHGIHTPLQLREASAQLLRAAFNGIVGQYWHDRLHFKTLDMQDQPYRNMSAMRHISKDQRKNKQTLEDIFLNLCTTLEQRMLKQGVLCKDLSVSFQYESGFRWQQNIKPGKLLQSAIDIKQLIENRMHQFEQVKEIDSLFNDQLIAMAVIVGNFAADGFSQLELIGNESKKNSLRKVTYDLKGRFGSDKVGYATQLDNAAQHKDIIGFGSVKDMY